MARFIYLCDPKFAPLPNDNIVGWLRSNDLEPEEVVGESVAMISDGLLTVTTFVLDEGGAKVYDKHYGALVARKEFRTVPLLSAPENFNL